MTGAIGLLSSRVSTKKSIASAKVIDIEYIVGG